MWGPARPVTDERASVPPAGDSVAPAFYAVGDRWLAGLVGSSCTRRIRRGHLSYIVVGACLAPYVKHDPIAGHAAGLLLLPSGSPRTPSTS